MPVRHARCNCALAVKSISFALLVLLEGAACAEPVRVEGGLVQGNVVDGLLVYRGRFRFISLESCDAF